MSLTQDEGIAHSSDLSESLTRKLPPSPSELKECLSKRWLLPDRRLPRSWTSSDVTHWSEGFLLGTDKDGSIEELLRTQSGHLNTNIEFMLAGLDAKVVGFRAASQSPISQLTARTSSSMARQPARYETDFVRGRSGNYPFTPGGLEKTSILDNPEGEDLETIEELEKGFETTRGGIRTVAPGFTRGLDFSDLVEYPDLRMEDEKDVGSGLKTREMRSEDVRLNPVYTPFTSTDAPSGRKPFGTGKKQDVDFDEEVDRLLPESSVSLVAAIRVASVRHRPVTTKKDWAQVVNVNQQLSNFRELVPVMAKEYPFELDNFQKEAIYHLEMGDSIFVAAHTSAGKTVVAEYAIALAARHMTRCIYTSPIKALSNQKFRDFKQTFDPESIGILTGDVQINPEGNCLIMTTEILRSMLYKGADLIRDVEFVVFDEVHYINDSERGVVWEEVIILLPAHVTLILLSATIPNTKEFADWVGRTRKKDIYVISTLKRPVPLEHFLYANRELHKIVNESGEFLSQGWKDAGEALKRLQVKEREASGSAPLVRRGAAAASRGQRVNVQTRVKRGSTNSQRGNVSIPKLFGASGPNSGRGHQEDQNLWVHLIGVLRKKQLLPSVAFTFSKKKCESNASSMPNTDLCSAKEKSEVHVVIERSLTRLSDDDKKLPQITRMRGLLSRGIGVHHGGLLPIVKEIVEILFTRGLVKILFATETFAMGVNMPARSVIFSSIRKHDGQNFRELLPGEYTQMSGRAGRRGLDCTGVVVIICGEQPPDTPTLHKMILGQPTKLQSQFRLTYNMILNLLRVEVLRVEELIRRSFSENAQQRLLPGEQKKVKENEKSLQALELPQDLETVRDFRQYHRLSSELVELNSEMIDELQSHPSGSQLFSSGRIVVLRDDHFRDNLAVILKSALPLRRQADGRVVDSRSYFVLAFVTPEIRAGSNDISAESVLPIWPPQIKCSTDNLTYELAVITSSSIVMVTKHTLSVDFNGIADAHRKSSMVEALNKFLSLGLLDKITETPKEQLLERFELLPSKLKTLNFREKVNERALKLSELQQLLHVENMQSFEENYRVIHKESIINQRLTSLRLALSEENLELLPEYGARIEVLKELNFIDENANVMLKGRMACEINSAHELILTEIILENVLADYDPAETVALLSSLVFQEKSDAEPTLTPALERGCERFGQIAEQIEKVIIKHQVEEDKATARGRGPLNFGMVELVWQWAQGMPFSQLMTLSDIQEGTIVRTMVRLDECCGEIRDAARIIGSASLGIKMESCQNLIKRDVIFVTSLYI
ncbi:NUC185 domain-domain-containing protein [Phakopsora pachyrhizi]|uniref:NUC185 domain-domain-containing protein n=1 Tax=Phakopsora pachyrhizi TaxID=170000 RepID=A0AAV0BAB7_PHAPC|nr:NUC185 domain-domain-containing protein [Phakopsora pachyrhizi]